MPIQFKIWIMNSEKLRILKIPGGGVFLSVLFVVCFSLFSFSQETDTIVPIQKDLKSILRMIDIRDVAGNKLKQGNPKFSGHFTGIDFGFNMFLNRDYSGYTEAFMDNDIFRSNSVCVNVFQQSFDLQKNKNTFGLVTGLGFHLQSFRLSDETTLFRDENDLIQPQHLSLGINQKSKMTLVSVTVPLMVEWQIPINHYDNRMYISAGAQASFRLHSYLKVKCKNSSRQKCILVDDFSLHTFKYALMLRSGYRWFNIFASYDLVPLFKKDKGPELVSFTFGIMLLRF